MSVDARALLIKNNSLGVDPLVDQILTEGSAERALFTQALSIQQSKLKRQYVESCLLASRDIPRIAALLEIPQPVIEMYAAVFYDVVELDKLSKMELLEVKDKAERLMKLWALSQGLDFVAWRLGKAVPVNPIEGLKDLFTTCVYKSKEAMFNPNDSNASVESTKWVKLSLDIGRLLKMWTLDTEAAKKDIELALQEVVPEFKGYDSLDREFEEAGDTSVSTDVPDFPAIPEA